MAGLGGRWKGRWKDIYIYISSHLNIKEKIKKMYLKKNKKLLYHSSSSFKRFEERHLLAEERRNKYKLRT